MSKIHEQHATDMAHLVETFRKKTNEVQSAGPPMVNTIAIAWEQVRAGDWSRAVNATSQCPEMLALLEQSLLLVESAERAFKQDK